MSIADDLNQKVLAAFQVEHREHLESIRQLLAAAQCSDSAINPTQLEEALRLAHTLKGGARVCDLKYVEMLGHRLETLYAYVHEGDVPLDADVIHVSQLVLDAIEDLMAALAACEPQVAPNAAIQAIDRLLEQGNKDSNQHSVIETAPAHTIARKIADRQPASSFPQRDMVRISAESLDRLLRLTGRFQGESLRQHHVAAQIGHLQQRLDGLERQFGTIRKTLTDQERRQISPQGNSLELGLNDLERDMRGISRTTRRLRATQQRNAWSLGSLVDEVQEDVRRAPRFTSAEGVFQGFRKMVRDLAAELGKKVDFQVSGFDIQADRMVLQAIKDPLMHMLRNAVVHGLETPAERTRLGKNEAGTVQVQLEVSGNRLLVVVDDDGRGVDLSVIGQVAVRRGLVTQQEASARRSELGRMIFQPGFTTSETVSELAGRGMGLSVVLESVQRLQGEVQLRPKPSAGATLLVSVPLSICTHRMLLVSAAGQTIALPVNGLEQLLRCVPREIETVEGRAMVSYQNDLVPLVSLAHLLGSGPSDLKIESGILHIAILKCANRRVAVCVDAFVAERDALLESLNGLAQRGSRFSAAFPLEDDSVALVLNIGCVMDDFDSAHKTPRSRIVPAEPAKQVPRILVVDDSFTARTLEKTLLEAYGYRVEVAVDGGEALRRLRSEDIDLVITDIEMPCLNGFALLEAMKQDARLRNVPVILVTSLDQEEDQQRGLTLGADAYVIKRKFDHQELLNTIRQLI